MSIITACKTEELAPGGSLRVECSPEPVAVFNVDGNLFACSATCPHAGGPLHEGYISGNTLTCPWHGWSFDLDTGGIDPEDGINRYRVFVEGGEVKVEMPNS